MRTKIVVLLASPSVLSPGDLQAVVDQLVARGVLGGLEITAFTQHPEDPSKELIAAVTMGADAAQFTGALELAGPPGSEDSLRRAVEGLSHLLPDSVDTARCALLAGDEHVIVAGHAPLVHLFALRRLPEVTQTEFHDHWLRVHASLGHVIPGIVAYRQFHVDADRSTSIAHEAGLGVGDYNGLAETFCESTGGFREIMSSSEVAGEGLSDQKEFIDNSRSTGALYTVCALSATPS